MKTLDWSVETLGRECNMFMHCDFTTLLMKTLDWSVETLDRECNMFIVTLQHS